MSRQGSRDARYERDPETIGKWWSDFIMTADGYRAIRLGPTQRWGRYSTYLRGQGLRAVQYKTFRELGLHENP